MKGESGSGDEVAALVTAVLQSPKYAHITPTLVRRIAERELANRRSYKEALKATKNKLHQVGGAYWEGRPDWAAALARLQAAQDDPAALRAVCRELMGQHASTRERLPILAEFYNTVLADLPPVRSVLDVACGLNPLALPWMGLPPGVVYTAVDIYGDMMAFLQQVWPLLGVQGQALWQDIVGQPVTQPVELALVLKTLPCLEQGEKGAAARLLDGIQARYLLVTYPAQSLGGRGKGMVANYTEQFMALANGRNWVIRRYEFSTELAFWVEQRSGGGVGEPETILQSE